MKRTEERRLLRRLVIEAAYEEGVTVKRYCEEHDLREYWHRVAGLPSLDVIYQVCAAVGIKPHEYFERLGK